MADTTIKPGIKPTTTAPVAKATVKPAAAPVAKAPAAKPVKQKKETKPAAKTESKPKAEEKKEERVMTVSLRDAWNGRRNNRAPSALKVLKREIERHTKKEAKIDQSLNSVVWAKGAQKPPRTVKVRLEIGANAVRAYAAK